MYSPRAVTRRAVTTRRRWQHVPVHQSDSIVKYIVKWIMAVKESALEHTLPRINTGWGTHDDRRTVYFSRWYSRGMGKARPLLCWGTHFHLFLSDTHTHTQKVLTAQKTQTQNKVKEEEYKSQICLRCSCGDGVLFLKRSGGVRFWNVQILPRFFFFLIGNTHA